jgi:hypothetical protein
MPADDLLGAVALDAGGARVPAVHPAAIVEQENRVVRDARHQPPELLVGRVGGGRGRNDA